MLAFCQPLTKQAGSGSVPKWQGSPTLLVAVPTVLLELTETFGTADGSVLKYRKSFDFLILVPLGSLAVKKKEKKKMLRYGYFIKYPFGCVFCYELAKLDNSIFWTQSQ